MNKVNVIKMEKLFFDPRWLIVSYGLLDVAANWLRVQRFADEALKSEISLIHTPLAMMVDSLLLLIV
jgi:hypothetical protein